MPQIKKLNKKFRSVIFISATTFCFDVFDHTTPSSKWLSSLSCIIFPCFWPTKISISPFRKCLYSTRTTPKLSLEVACNQSDSSTCLEMFFTAGERIQSQSFSISLWDWKWRKSFYKNWFGLYSCRKTNRVHKPRNFEGKRRKCWKQPYLIICWSRG